MADHESLFEIEATVVSGLEEVAKDEVEKTLLAKIYEVKLGRVNFLVENLNLKKILTLRSVDNLYFIVHRFSNISFPADAEDSLKLLRSFVERVDWTRALDIWHDFFTPAEQNVSSLPSYRVTCKRFGSHSFESPQAATHFGGALNDFCGWKVDLSNFDVEVMLIIIEDEVRVGISLTKASLHRRNIINFGNTTLKPTIAHGMLWHCNIQPGDIVCDPLCGSGSIPVENGMVNLGSYNICGDVGSKLVQRTLDNWNNYIEKTKERSSLGTDVLRWNACHLPLRDNSVDVFVTDLPFGKRVGSRKSNWSLYAGVLKEFARVSRQSTGRACLLTQDKKCIVKSLETLSRFWKRGPTIPINIGGLSASIYVLYRTCAEFAHAAKRNDSPEKRTQ